MGATGEPGEQGHHQTRSATCASASSWAGMWRVLGRTPAGHPCRLASSPVRPIHLFTRAHKAMAWTPTRLGHMDRPQQEWLVNWGGTDCDAATLGHVATAATPGGLPIPLSSSST
jgi:hypothetical protein